jgi:hypothetical protein
LFGLNARLAWDPQAESRNKNAREKQVALDGRVKELEAEVGVLAQSNSWFQGELEAAVAAHAGSEKKAGGSFNSSNKPPIPARSTFHPCSKHLPSLLEAPSTPARSTVEMLGAHQQFPFDTSNVLNLNLFSKFGHSVWWLLYSHVSFQPRPLCCAHLCVLPTPHILLCSLTRFRYLSL